LLTCGTTTVTVAFMYFLGGAGIHGIHVRAADGEFLVGTYSSVAIAAPILLPTVNPSKLRIGMVINVPDLNAPLAVRAAAYDAKPTAGARAEVDSSKSYRVRAADTLMGIARRLYGDGQAWQKIYDANRDAIGPNPARLTVGMVLRLPEPPTVASTN
jgi:phage tail protein X